MKIICKTVKPANCEKSLLGGSRTRRLLACSLVFTSVAIAASFICKHCLLINNAGRSVQHFEGIARQLKVMLEEAERQEADKAVKECRWQLRQIESEIHRLRKMGPSKTKDQ